MQRITDKDLEAVARRINLAMGTPDLPWAPRDGGGMRANIGNFHLSHAYGGVALHQMQTEGGGVSDIFGCHMPKRELYDRMHAFLRGVEAGRATEEV